MHAGLRVFFTHSKLRITSRAKLSPKALMTTTRICFCFLSNKVKFKPKNQTCKLHDVNSFFIAPFLHHRSQVLDLRVGCAIEQVENFRQCFRPLVVSNHLLEHPNAGSTFAFPVFWIRVKTLEHIECLRRNQRSMCACEDKTKGTKYQPLLSKSMPVWRSIRWQ